MVIQRGPTWRDKAWDGLTSFVTWLFWGLLAASAAIIALSFFITRESIAYGVSGVFPGQLRWHTARFVRAVTIPVGLVETETGWGRERVPKINGLEFCLPSAAWTYSELNDETEKEFQRCVEKESSTLPFRIFEQSWNWTTVWAGDCLVRLDGEGPRYLPTRIEVFATVKDKWDTKFGMATIVPRTVANFTRGYAYLKFDDAFCRFWEQNARDITWMPHRMYGVRL